MVAGVPEGPAPNATALVGQAECNPSGWDFLYCGYNNAINHPFGNGLYKLSMAIWGMVYEHYTHIIAKVILFNTMFFKAQA